MVRRGSLWQCLLQSPSEGGVLHLLAATGCTQRATLRITRPGGKQEKRFVVRFCLLSAQFSTYGLRGGFWFSWLHMQVCHHGLQALFIFCKLKGGEKNALLLVGIKSNLCLFLIKQLAPTCKTEEFYCWAVWKLYMVFLRGKANAWCWVSVLPKAKCISPWVRRARPAGTKRFTLALTAKRQQWIMFINQPRSSPGGAAESELRSASVMPFPPAVAANKQHERATALTSRAGVVAPRSRQGAGGG